MLDVAVPRVVYTGNGSASTFAVSDVDGNPIYFASNSEINVEEVVIATGVATTLVEGVGYSLSGGPTSGIVTRTAGALASTKKLVIWRETALDQPTQFGAVGPFHATVHTALADRDRRIDQELAELIGRSLKMDRAEAAYVAGGKRISGGADPVDDQDFVTKNHGDTYYGGASVILAASSATNASNSATAAAAAYDAFDDRYLGAKSSDPLVDNDGDALEDGALYWSTTEKRLKVYDLDTLSFSPAYPTNAMSVVSDVTELKTLNPSSGDVAFVADESRETTYVFKTGDYSANIAASDYRYVASNADSDGSDGAWLLAESVQTGEFSASGGARILRYADRAFFGEAVKFNGEVGAISSLEGISDDVRKYHPWAYRDGTVVAESADGSIAIAGLSETRNGVNFWAAPSAYPAAFGVAGFVINNSVVAPHSPAWAGYFDAKRMNNGFTVGVEVACSNLTSDVITPNIFNLWGGGHASGVCAWKQAGGGLDIVSTDYVDWNSIAAYDVYLSSYNPGGGKTAWGVGTTYSKGYVAGAGYGGTNYVCRVGHTSPGSGTFAAYRAANPSHWATQQRVVYSVGLAVNAGDMVQDSVSRVWYYVQTDGTTAGATFKDERAANPANYKEQPAAAVGRIVHVGSLQEQPAGSNTFVVDAVPTNHFYVWQKDSGSTNIYGAIAGTAAYIGADETATGQGWIASGTTWRASGSSVRADHGTHHGNVNRSGADILDHYLESSLTLGVTFGGGSTGVTFNSRSMNSTRIGNIITVHGSFALTSKGSSTGVAAITGLPVAAVGLGNAMRASLYLNLAAGITSPPMGLASGTTIALYKSGAGSASAMTDADFQNNSLIHFTINYRVA